MRQAEPEDEARAGDLAVRRELPAPPTNARGLKVTIPAIKTVLRGAGLPESSALEDFGIILQGGYDFHRGPFPRTVEVSWLNGGLVCEDEETKFARHQQSSSRPGTWSHWSKRYPDRVSGPASSSGCWSVESRTMGPENV